MLIVRQRVDRRDLTVLSELLDIALSETCGSPRREPCGLKLGPYR